MKKPLKDRFEDEFAWFWFSVLIDNIVSVFVWLAAAEKQAQDWHRYKQRIGNDLKIASKIEAWRSDSIPSTTIHVELSTELSFPNKQYQDEILFLDYTKLTSKLCQI
jgi:hypothetical protein